MAAPQSHTINFEEMQPTRLKQEKLINENEKKKVFSSFIKTPPDDGLKIRNIYRDFINTQNLIKKKKFEFFYFFVKHPY